MILLINRCGATGKGCGDRGWRIGSDGDVAEAIAKLRFETLMMIFLTRNNAVLQSGGCEKIFFIIFDVCHRWQIME